MNILSSFVNFINKNDDINVNKAKLKSYLGVDNDTELVDLLERTKIKKAIKNFNKDRIEVMESYTINDVMTMLKNNDDPNTTKILGLTPGQRLYVKLLSNKSNFFADTFNGGPIPTILIAKQDVDFYTTTFKHTISPGNKNSHLFCNHFINLVQSNENTDNPLVEKGESVRKKTDTVKQYTKDLEVTYKSNGFQLTSQIIKDYENSTGVCRKPIKISKCVEVIELIFDGQQRITMLAVIFTGTYNGYSAHINLDHFNIFDGNAYANDETLEWVDEQSIEYINFKNRKTNKNELINYIINCANISDFNEKEKAKNGLNNSFPARDIIYWENLTEYEILKRLIDEYGVIVLTDDVALKYLSIIEALKKFYFDAKIVHFQKKPNMSPIEMEKAFFSTNTTATKVTPPELAISALNGIMSHVVEPVVNAFAKFFLYLGVDDENVARSYGIRGMAAILDWTTSMNDLLHKVHVFDMEFYESIINTSEEKLPVLMDIITQTTALITSNNKLVDYIATDTKTGKSSHIDIGLFGMFLLGLMKCQIENNTTVFNRKKMKEIQYIYMLVNNAFPLSKTYGSDAPLAFSRIRDFYNQIASLKGGLTIVNLRSAAKTVFGNTKHYCNYLKNIDAQDMLQKTSDRAQNLKVLSWKAYAVGNTILPSTAVHAIDVEHIQASDNFKTIEKFKIYDNANGGCVWDDLTKERFSHTKKLVDTDINKIALSSSTNRSLQNKSVDAKYNEISVENQPEFLETIGVSQQLYISNPNILKPKNETELLFVNYYKDIRAREKLNMCTLKFENPNYTYEPATADEICEKFIAKTFFNDEGINLYPTLEKEFRIKYDKIKNFLSQH